MFNLSRSEGHPTVPARIYESTCHISQRRAVFVLVARITLHFATREDYRRMRRSE